MNVCTCKKKFFRMKERAHPPSPWHWQLKHFTPYWGAIFPASSIFAIDSSSISFPPTFAVSCFLSPFTFELFLHCAEMQTVNSPIPASCGCCLSQPPAQLLCMPHVELLVGKALTLEAAAVEGIELLSTPWGDQTCVIYFLNISCCWQ